MNDWQSTWLGRRSRPRDLSGFEIEAFCNLSDAERRVIEERCGPALKIALALQTACCASSTNATCARFTKDAVDFARSQPIELIDGAKLEEMVRGINGVAAAPAAAVPARPAPEPSAAPAACPRCSSPTVLRTARGNGGQFYGCSTYPKCRGVRQVRWSLC